MENQPEVVGHVNIIRFLEQSIAKSALHHAYIFTGPKGVGKLNTSLFFIKTILCENRLKDAGSCDECVSCKHFKKGIHPDMIELKRELDDSTKKQHKNITLSQVQRVQSSLQTTPVLGKFKVLLIHEAETLNKNSNNALLKTLEEPARSVIIILLYQNIQFVPKTIASRSQILTFYPVHSDIIAESLAEKGAERQLARTLSRRSGGLPSKAFEWFFDKDALVADESLMETLQASFSLPLYQRIRNIQKLALPNGTSDNVLSVLDAYLVLFRDAVMTKNGCSYLNLYLNQEYELKKNLSNLLKGYQDILYLKKLYQSNVNTKGIIDALSVVV